MKNIFLILCTLLLFTSCSNSFIYKQALKRKIIKDSVYVTIIDTCFYVDTTIVTKEQIKYIEGDSIHYEDSTILIRVKYDSLIKKLKANITKKAQIQYIRIPVVYRDTLTQTIKIPQPQIIMKEGFFYKSGQALWLGIILLIITYFSYKWIKNTYLR